MSIKDVYRGVFAPRLSERVPVPRLAPRTHDYTVRYWGHDYVFEPMNASGTRARMQGWGHGIRNGDYLLIKGVLPGTSTRYRVDEIVYHGDPRDMWVANVTFSPREEEPVCTE